MLKARQACRVYQNEVKKKEDDKVNNDGDNGVGVVNYTNAGDDRGDVGRGVMINVMITMMTMKKMKMVKVRMI